jgi:amidohydrolase
MNHAWIVGLGCALGSATAAAEISGPELDAAAASIESRVVEWRRDFHRHPELANRETRTALKVAEHLRALGLDVRTGMAHTGVVAVVEGGLPGPTVLLRADMDALPITERTDVPFRSAARGEFRGQEVGVMHACGHDAHTAILMGVADILVRMRDRLPGKVLLVFQPAEEGVPEGEKGGAPMMLEQGLLEVARPDAAFALHVGSSLPSGVVSLRPGPLMAGSDFFRILVTGRQTHGSRPWSGVDPIVAASAIVTAAQTIVSREMDLTAAPAVVTVGAIRGGVRHNIIPNEVEMLGTIRSFSDEDRSRIIERLGTVASSVAEAHGATATLEMMPAPNPVLVNDPELTARATATLERALGAGSVRTSTLLTVAEDYAHIARRVPSVYWWVGVTPPGQDPSAAPDNHSDLFYLDEAGMQVGLRSLLHVAVDFLQGAAR